MLALAPAAPTATCVVQSPTTSVLTIQLDATPATIDASAAPVVVNGTPQPCANLTAITITGTAAGNTVSALTTGLAGVQITADLLGGGDRLDATGSQPIGPILGGAGGDELSAPDAGGSQLRGDGDADTLIGGGEADDLQGGAGDDTLRPGRGTGANDGGGGGDTLDYSDVGVNVTASLAAGSASTTSTGVTLAQTIANIDNLVGGTGTDTFTGNGDPNELDGGTGSAIDTLAGGGAADHLIGGGGGDTLAGEAGADILDGGAGEDRLIGGAGADALHGDGDADTAS